METPTIIPAVSIPQALKSAKSIQPPRGTIKKGMIRRDPNFVRIDHHFQSGVRLDIRYATPNNFLGAKLYIFPEAYIRKEIVADLAKAVDALREHGFGIIVYDAYRPWYVTKAMWDVTPEHQHAYVADPATGSHHNRGTALDLGLFRLSDGRPARMQSAFDDLSEKAHSTFRCTPAQQLHREILHKAMLDANFTNYEKEWWHFQHVNSKKFPLCNYPI